MVNKNKEVTQERDPRDRIKEIIRICDEIRSESSVSYSSSFGNYATANAEDIILILSTLGLKREQRITDLGSGDGRWLFAASVLGFTAEGYEHDPRLTVVTEKIRREVTKQGLLSAAENKRITFREEDFLKLPANLSHTDAVIYWPGSMHDIPGEPDSSTRVRCLLEHPTLGLSQGSKIVITGYRDKRDDMSPKRFPGKIATWNPTRVFVR